MPTQYCPNHVRAAIFHSLKRAYERYSVSLTEYDIFKMSDLVIQGKAKLKKSNSTRQIFKLSYKGKNFVIVFDMILLIIVTFLPHKALRQL